MPKRFLTICALLVAASWAVAQDTDWEAELGDWSGDTLRIIMIQDPWVDAFEEINREFEELTGAEVIIDSYGYDQTHAREVLIGTSESDEYDVVVLDSPWPGEFAEAGIVRDLRPFIEEDADIVQFDDFIPAFQEVAEWDGEIIGVPFGAYFAFMHYRTDLFEEAGLDAPETIEDFREAAEFFTDNADYPQMFGTAFVNQRGSPVGQAFLEYIWNFGGKPFESTYPGSPDPYADMTPLLDSPESIATVNFLREMLEYQPPGAENFAWDERATTFAVGQTGLITAWNVRTPGFSDEDESAIIGNFDTALFPALEGQDAVPPLGGWIMGINSYTEQDELAWDYIKWFTSPEIHKQFVLAGGPVSRMSLMDDPDVLEAKPWVETTLESAERAYAEVRPRIPESFEVIDIIGQHVSQAILGQVPVEEAMQTADEEVAELLRQNGYNVNQ